MTEMPDEGPFANCQGVQQRLLSPGKAPQRWEANWMGLRLVVEERPGWFQAFVYDPVGCEVLLTGARMHLDSARFAAADFVAVRRYGADHSLDLNTLIGHDSVGI